MHRDLVSHKRLHGDDGALVIELAFVVPLMVVLLLGIFEFGFAFREKSSLSSALRNAERSDTVNGATRSADYNAILAFEAGMANAKNIKINFLVIYKTDSTGAPPSPNCLLGVSTANCNYYTNAQLTAIAAAADEPSANMGNVTDTTCALTAVDVNYCPATRTASQSVSAGPDWVGFYVNATYTSYTGLLPSTVTMTDSSLARLDPQPGS